MWQLWNFTEDLITLTLKKHYDIDFEMKINWIQFTSRYVALKDFHVHVFLFTPFSWFCGGSLEDEVSTLPGWVWYSRSRGETTLYTSGI